MSRKKKPRMEYRYYEAPEKCPVLALLGEKWVQNYGYQIDYLHFHNMMEIGVCYYGEGTIVNACFNGPLIQFFKTKLEMFYL